MAPYLRRLFLHCGALLLAARAAVAASPAPVTGAFWTDMDDEVSIYVNGTRVCKSKVNINRSPTVQLKVGDHVVFHLHNFGAGHRFIAAFVSEDNKRVVSFRARDLKISPEAETPDFTAEELAQWTKSPAPETHTYRLPVPTASEFAWSDVKDGTLVAVVHAGMFSDVAGSVVPTVAPPPDAKAAQPMTEASFVQNHTGALVVVRDEAGAGSGFLASFAGKVYLVTNIHVAAGMRTPVFTLLNGTRLIPTSCEAAVGHDVMRFALKEVPAQAIEVGSDLEHNIRLGDPIGVFGNSGGGGVVTSLPGKIEGIGPDRLEVSSTFIPGNSGSPIIHMPTGRVIGIATYLMTSRDQFNGGGMVTRRFGFRLDSVKTWETVNWLAFHEEGEQVEKVVMLTKDIISFMEALKRHEQPNFVTETLRRPALEWRQRASNPRMSPADRLSATQSFLGSLRSMSRGDVANLEPRLRYSYFREKLSHERKIRDEMYKSFDELAQNLSLPSRRGF